MNEFIRVPAGSNEQFFMRGATMEVPERSEGEKWSLEAKQPETRPLTSVSA
jgi:hypothetical protein